MWINFRAFSNHKSSEHSYLQQSAFTIGSKEGLFSLASTDPAWMNAVLCLISLHYDLQAGKGISTICLLHRSEALRIVNQRLIDSPQDVSEETIGAIASLANFDVRGADTPVVESSC